MHRRLRFTSEARAQLEQIAAAPAKHGLHKQLLKTLGWLETNPGHPGLHTHEYRSLTGAQGERIWEAYVQNQTPGAYRIFFHYGPDEGSAKKRVPILTILIITPHP